MRDSARQRADAFHALGAEKLVLELFAFGNIGVNADPLPDRSIFIQNGHGADQHVAIGFIGYLQPVFDIVAGPTCDGSGPDSRCFSPIFRMNSVEPAPASKLLKTLAGEGRPPGLLHGKFTGGRSVPDDGRCRLHQRAITLLIEADFDFRRFALGDVTGGPDDEVNLAIG